jgi:BMFP domain-containing protein YqiC
MQTDNRILDGMARFFTNAAGAAQAFKSEMETMMKSRIERMIADLDFVPREEFDAVKAMAAKARTENEKLAARVAELEARVGLAKGKHRRSAPKRKM